MLRLHNKVFELLVQLKGGYGGLVLDGNDKVRREVGSLRPAETLGDLFNPAEEAGAPLRDASVFACSRRNRQPWLEVLKPPRDG